MRRAQSRTSPRIGDSLREYGRGIAGGFLFSLPLLYTMEVWWTGFTVTPLRLLAGLAETFILLCAYNAYAGLRYDWISKYCWVRFRARDCVLVTHRG